MAGEAWTEWPFPDVIDFQEGPGILAKDFREEGVPLVRLSGLERGASLLDGCNFLDPTVVERRWSHFALQKGDILLSTSASLGRIALVSEAGVGAIPYTGIIRMRPRDERVFAPFIRYLLEGPDFQWQAEVAGAGSVIRHFGPMHLRRMTVRLPPPSEQRAIAHILGTLDDKIELNRRMNETLEAMARAIFKSWFVDFDPVRAKAEGRKPFGMDAATAALFPASFEDSPLGKIPKGWRVGSIGEIAANPRRGVEPKEIADGTPYIALEHMPQRSIALAKWDLADKVVSNKFEFRQGEILFGKLRPYFHKVGVAVLDGVCSTDILVIKPKSEEWLGLVLGHVSSKEFVDHTDAVSTGTKMPRTNWQDMARYEIALPDSRLANVFGHFVRTLVEMIRQNILQSHTLAAIRDALLPKLISGEIRVRATHHPAEVATL
jgi:type I restriction enzyme S subunit